MASWKRSLVRLVAASMLSSGAVAAADDAADALRLGWDEWTAGEASPGTDTPADLVPSADAASRPTLVGEPVCVSADVPGASGQVCGRRDRFGATWSLRLSDTLDDGRPVYATVGLEVEEAPDETERLDHDEGYGSSVDVEGIFRPRAGLAIGDLTLRTCVARRFLPDRCRSSSVALPQIEGRGTEAQLERLEELVFEVPLERFMAEWARDRHSGTDADFDWSGNGCSAGPLAGLFDERLRAACLRHDFAYHNLGVLGFDPRDATRLRVDRLLAADAVALGQDALAPALRRSLQRFGGPAFYGQDLAALWEVPAFLVPLLRTGEAVTGRD